jgi:hypothetical protein
MLRFTSRPERDVVAALEFGFVGGRFGSLGHPRTGIISELVRLDRRVVGGQVAAASLSRSMSSMPWVLA